MSKVNYEVFDLVQPTGKAKTVKRKSLGTFTTKDEVHNEIVNQREKGNTDFAVVDYTAMKEMTHYKVRKNYRISTKPYTGKAPKESKTTTAA